MNTRADAVVPTAGESTKPPGWLIAATGTLALAILAMAVAETNLWMHYLIDAGESFSLVGLGVITVAGIYLFTTGRLTASLPLAVPWLLFPVITQGDQIIDNLSIDWMRFIVHLLLGIIFGAPVAIVVVAARFAAAPSSRRAPRRIPGWLAAAVPGLRQVAEGRVREGSAVLAAMLLAAETWVAARFLGELMVVTLIVMIGGVLGYGFAGAAAPVTATRAPRSERRALVLLLVGVAMSVGLFVGYKNRPGAYQGSPSSYMDPSERSSGFRLDRIAVPTQPAASPSNPEGVRATLTGYAGAFERLLAGYYILDRNYNYDFHNRLFLRSTPLLPDYRAVGPRLIAEAADLKAGADKAFQTARPSVPAGDALAALLDDVRAYADYTFARSPVLARMTEGFLQTEAGLQHATHIYEGEGKMLGVQLDEVLRKHAAVLSAPPVIPVASEFVTISRAVHDKYANRIIGF